MAMFFPRFLSCINRDLGADEAIAAGIKYVQKYSKANVNRDQSKPELVIVPYEEGFQICLEV